MLRDAGFDLLMPDLEPLMTGTIGMGESGIENYSRIDIPERGIKGVMNHMLELGQIYPGYGGHTEGVWDCEDRAFLVAANVRCKYPGCPIGVTTGVAGEGSFVGERHAVVIFWYRDGSGYKSIYFDPILPDTEIKNFQPELIIPFPLYIPNSTDTRKELTPFDDERKFPYRTSGLLLFDKTHDIVNIEDVKSYIRSELNKCPEPQRLSERKIFRRKWTQLDRVLWAFSHARLEFKGAPIGLAIGTKEGNNYSVLMLWPDKEHYIFWDIDSNQEISDFAPRFALV
jgi:hypothetical protein